MSMLSEQIQATRLSYWEREREAARNTTALLVEGDDDKAVLEALMRRRNPAFPSQVTVVVAGSRKNVLAAAGFFPNHAIHLLIDRDIWSDQEIEAERRRQAPTPLHVTSGWCLRTSSWPPRGAVGLGVRYSGEITERPIQQLDMSSVEQLCASLSPQFVWVPTERRLT